MTDALVFVSPQDVITEAVNLFRVGSYDLLHSRARPYSDYRLATMATVREVCGMSYPQTARAFGRHHTTVLSACRRVAATPRLQATSVALAERVMARSVRWENGRGFF